MRPHQSASLSIDVCLPPNAMIGHGINIRRSTSSDRLTLSNFFDRLTQQSRTNRFLSSVGSVAGSMLDAFVDADQESHLALLAVFSSNGHDVVIGEARVISDPCHPATSEFAIAVADDWQCCGIGQQLLRRLEAIAIRQSVLVMVADTFASNKPMTALARSLNYSVKRHPFDFKLCRLEKALSTKYSAGLQSNSNPSTGFCYR